MSETAGRKEIFEALTHEEMTSLSLLLSRYGHEIRQRGGEGAVQGAIQRLSMIVEADPYERVHGPSPFERLEAARAEGRASAAAVSGNVVLLINGQPFSGELSLVCDPAAPNLTDILGCPVCGRTLRECAGHEAHAREG